MSQTGPGECNPNEQSPPQMNVTQPRKADDNFVGAIQFVWRFGGVWGRLFVRLKVSRKSIAHVCIGILPKWVSFKLKIMVFRVFFKI